MRSLIVFIVIASLSCAAHQQGRIKRDESTPGYPLNYFTSSDDYSGDIEVSHEFYRPTADVSLTEDTSLNANDEQQQLDSLMSTTIDSHQREAFDASSSSEYDNYDNNHEELIGVDQRSEKLLIDHNKQQIRMSNIDDAVDDDKSTSKDSSHKTHQQNAQNSKLINYPDELKYRISNSDKISSCDDSINERVSNYLKFGRKINVGHDDLSIDVTHDVFESHDGLLMGIIYQGECEMTF